MEYIKDCLAWFEKERERVVIEEYLLLSLLIFMSVDILLYYYCCIILLINCYTGNSTTNCHSGSMSDNRNLTGVFHQKVSSLPVSIASDSRSFQSS